MNFSKYDPILCKCIKCSKDLSFKGDNFQEFSDRYDAKKYQEHHTGFSSKLENLTENKPNFLPNSDENNHLSSKPSMETRSTAYHRHDCLLKKYSDLEKCRCFPVPGDNGYIMYLSEQEYLFIYGNGGSPASGSSQSNRAVPAKPLDNFRDQPKSDLEKVI